MKLEKEVEKGRRKRRRKWPVCIVDVFTNRSGAQKIQKIVGN